MSLTELLNKLTPYNFDWSNYRNDERTVVEQMRKAIQFYVDKGILNSSTSCNINHRASSKAGTYNISTHVVTVYAWLFRSNSAQEVENTIKHEIAHAIDIQTFGIQYSGYSRYGRRKRILHGHTWKAIAVAVGDDGERCYDGKTVVNDTKKAHKYTLRADCCGMEVGRHKITENVRKGIERGSRTFSCCKKPRSQRTISIIQNH